MNKQPAEIKWLFELNPKTEIKPIKITTDELSKVVTKMYIINGEYFSTTKNITFIN